MLEKISAINEKAVMLAQAAFSYAREAAGAVFETVHKVDLSGLVPEQLTVRRIQIFVVFLLCVSAAWFRGGVYPPLQWPLITLSIFLCLSFFLFKPEERLRYLERIKNDPIFWFALGFLALIVLQTLNSGYWVVEDNNGFVEMPRRPFRLWPWSVDGIDAREMMVWFFPVFICIFLIRNVFEWRHIKILLQLLVWNAGILAFLGIIQHMVGARSMLGMWSIPGGRFFATFDYVNHAAEWFYLHAFIAMALLKDCAQYKKPPMQAVVWSLSLFLCLIAAMLTLSRFGAFVALALLFVALTFWVKRVLAKVNGAATVNVIVASVIVGLLGIVLFRGVGDGALAAEVQNKALFGEASVSSDFGERIVQMPMACSIISDYPLFGSGGWGYRWLARLYIPTDNAVWLDAAGKANVHCDPLQFITEFGVVGAYLMVRILMVLAVPALKGWRSAALTIWLGIGLCVIAFHSFFDLPFRCPAILLTWFILLAAYPRFAERQKRIKMTKTR